MRLKGPEVGHMGFVHVGGRQVRGSSKVQSAAASSSAALEAKSGETTQIKSQCFGFSGNIEGSRYDCRYSSWSLPVGGNLSAINGSRSIT